MVEGRAASPENRWLTLGQACSLLSVSAATLRHWADSGRVRVFRTVGGHRRFSREDIDGLAQVAPPAELARAPAGGEELALKRLRRRLRQAHGHWQETFDQEGRLRMRLLGRRLLSIASEYLTHRKRRPGLREEAQFIGQEYGAELARRGLSLTDAMEAFLFFRKSLADAAQQTLGGGHSVDEVAQAWEEVYGLADVVLLAIAAAYQKAPSTGSRRGLRPPAVQPVRQAMAN